MVAEWKLENHNGGYTYLDAVAAAVSFFLLAVCAVCAWNIQARFRFECTPWCSTFRTNLPFQLYKIENYEL
jgi:hypothetical protein